MQELAQAVVSGLLIGAIYALVAVGLTLIFGVMDIVNFAHGEFLMVAMYITFFTWSVLTLDPLLAIPFAALGVALIAMVVYLGAVKRVLRGPPLAQIVVTFGVLVLIRGLVQLLFTSNDRGITDAFVADFRIVIEGVVIGGPQLAAAAGAVVCTAALWWFIDRTETGAAISAVAQDPAAARLMGIDPNRIHLLAWGLSGASVGIAGALLMNFFTVSPTVGAAFGLVAFVVVSLGGFGSLRGAFVAGLLVGVIQDVVGLYWPAYGFAAIFFLYLAVVQIRPQGLFGVR
jgi:branched-chain amino acid transport system permease protein